MIDEDSRKYLRLNTAEEWRKWLMENGLIEKEIWLLFPKKVSGFQGISYFEALEESLCFGWIDGMMKRLDANFLSQRFSPRTAKSSWSEVNKHHARILIGKGKMADCGAAILPDLNPEIFTFPADIMEILRADGEVWENFCAFPRFYQNIRVAAIDSVRLWPEIFEKRLNYFLHQTRRNRRYGRFK